MPIELIKQAESNVDALILFEKDLDLARAENVSGFVGIPETKVHFDKLSLNDEMNDIFRDRLYRLGYLERRNLAPEDLDDLEGAVKKLQKEAGLTVDGWIGLQTWQALQELFSFENDSNLQKWNVLPFSPFMKKAVCLRLKTFGFDITVKSRQKKIDNKLKQWKAFLVVLGAAPKEELTVTTLVNWLFDIDRLSQLVYKNRRRLLQASNNKKLIHQCVGCLLKIELWLHGVDGVHPNGKVLQVKRYRKIRRKNIYRYKSDYRMLREFWSDVGIDTKHNDNPLVLYLRSFKYLTSDHEGALDKASVIDNVIGELESDTTLAKKTWEDMSVTGRLVDGLRRASRWLFRVIKKTAKFFIKKMKGVVRIAKYLVTEGVSFVRRTFKLLSDGLTMFLRNPIHNFDNKLILGRDTDFDMKVFIDKQLQSDELNRMTSYMEAANLRLKAAVRLTVLLVDIVKLMTTATAGFTWLWLIKSILQFRKKLAGDDVRLIKSAYLSYSS